MQNLNSQTVLCAVCLGRALHTWVMSELLGLIWVAHMDLV